MKAASFGYRRATTLADAHRLLAEGGPAARVVAGGQSLLAGLAFRLSEPGLLVDITRVEELRGVRLTESGAVSIGALTTHAALGRDPLVAIHAPLLADAVPLIAHPAIRNRGTLGGSLAYADPAAELPACCVALGATIVAVSARGSRRIGADRFFTGLFATALATDELIAGIEVPQAPPGGRSVILELARRSGDYAMAGIAMTARRAGDVWQEPRVVFFGVGETPVTAAGAMRILRDVAWSADARAAALAALDGDLDPAADAHGGPEFKRQLARTLLGRAMAQLQDGQEPRAT